MSKLGELLDKFFSYLSSKYSANTLRAYKLDISELVSRGVTWEDVNAPSKHLWRKYLAERGRDGLHQSARLLSAWRSFFKFCQDRGELVSSGLLKIRSQSVAPRAFRIPDLTEVCAYVERMPGGDWVAQRDRALVMLLYSTGMRIGEALGIKEWGGGDVVRICGKGGKYRDVPVLEVVQRQIGDYLRVRPKADWLFVGVRGGRLSYAVVYRLMQHTPWRVTHNLRRSAATHLLRRGVDIESVKLLLGHSKLSTTQRYIISDPEQLKQAYQSAQRLM